MSENQNKTTEYGTDNLNSEKERAMEERKITELPSDLREAEILKDWKEKVSPCSGLVPFIRSDLEGLVADAVDFDDLDDFLDQDLEPGEWNKMYTSDQKAFEAIENIFKYQHTEKLYFVHRRTGISILLEEYQAVDYVRKIVDAEFKDRILRAYDEVDETVFSDYFDRVRELLITLNEKKQLVAEKFVLLRSYSNPTHTLVDSLKLVDWEELLENHQGFGEVCLHNVMH